MNFTHKHPPLTDNHSATECLLRWLSPTLTLLQTMSRVRWVDNGQDCSSMCLMNYRLLQTLGKSKIQLLNPLIIENLSVTPWLMTDTTHLMASVKADRNSSSLFSFSIYLMWSVQSVADNETDVSVPGYFITQSRYKIVDFTIPFFSQGFYFWIKSSSVSASFQK